METLELIETSRLGKKRSHDYGAVYAWIVKYKVENDGLSPTLQQIADGNGLKSMSHVAYILDRLEKSGLIIQTKNGIKLPFGLYQRHTSLLDLARDYIYGHVAEILSESRKGNTLAVEITRVFGDGGELGFDVETIEKLVALIGEYNVQSATAARI